MSVPAEVDERTRRKRKRLVTFVHEGRKQIAAVIKQDAFHIRVSLQHLLDIVEYRICAVRTDAPVHAEVHLG